LSIDITYGDHSPATVKFPDIFTSDEHTSEDQYIQHSVLCYSITVHYEYQCIFYKNVHDDVISAKLLKTGSKTGNSVAPNMKLATSSFPLRRFFCWQFKRQISWQML